MGQERTRVRHERILDAALEVFSSRGYRDASVDDVAVAAATSKGGVYFHFPGKDALFLALLDRSARLLLSRVTESVSSEHDPVAKVDAALLALLRAFASHRRLARLFLVETLGAGPQFHARMVDVHGQFVAFIRRNLDEAVRQGIVQPFDTEIASQAWFGALNQVVTGWVLSDRPDRLEDAYPALRALLLRSVGIDPRRGAAASERAGELASVRSGACAPEPASGVPIRALRTAVEWARAAGQPRLVSWTTRLPPADPLAFFAARRVRGLAGAYWERPDEGFALVGLGAAWSSAPGADVRFAGVERAWRELLAAGPIEGADATAGPVLLGGFGFDPLRPSTELWRGFPPARMVLPRYLLTRRGDAGWLTVNLRLAPDCDAEAEARRIADELPALLEAGTPSTSAADRFDVEDVLPAEEWRRLVAEATAAIRRGAFEKVVLARAVRVRADRSLTPESVLAGLRASYPSCALFAFESGDGCFVGATPERLVRLRDGLVEVSSLAGTIRRGATSREDEALGAELLADPKNRDEHAVVVRTLLEQLSGAVEGIDAPAEPRLMRVRNVQHLHTPIRGRLAPRASLLGVVERLHPTPAVGGHPRTEALPFLRERERLDRGWYAGPVGWIDAAGEGELAVAIRSALLRGAEATLFAGCGIVADSDPASEHAESVLKLRPILSALGAPTP
ncbi:MAG TPA: isochorismate synthase [Chloroflexota bacterium]|jgi:isochorismate synthase|nr:isochorismate synthase [Chloroflexota bacterium]